MVQIKLIVAADNNKAIGYNNKLLWHLPNDLKFFKKNTWAMPVVMGRKTFDSVGARALPGRTNIIITRATDTQNTQNVVFVNSIQQAIEWAKQHNYKELFVAGGGQIYAEAMPLANTIIYTRVHTVIEQADTFFPNFEDEFTLVSKFDYEANDKHAYCYSFETWNRNN